MRQADASDVSESIRDYQPCSPPAARVRCRKQTAPLRVTRKKKLRGPSWGSRPSSELWIRQADTPNRFL
eukprot:7269-Pyramimonas_sp.AAC.1